MIAAPTEAELVHSLEPLVLRVAQRYAKTTVVFTWEDYLQMLRLEAVRAVRQWSPDGGASIWTYVWSALVNECLNANRDQRLRGYKAHPDEAPDVVSLDVVSDVGGDEAGGDMLLDTIPSGDDVAAEVVARCQVGPAWAFAEEVLNPRLLETLELSVGRRGKPLSQLEVAARLGCSQMQVSRRLQSARARLLADPRSQEFVGE